MTIFVSRSGHVYAHERQESVPGELVSCLNNNSCEKTTRFWTLETISGRIDRRSKGFLRETPTWTKTIQQTGYMKPVSVKCVR